MSELSYRLDRTIDIQAPVALVFEMLTTTEHWARWWGSGSHIDPRPGGPVLIRYPNGVEVAGEVLEVEPDRRLAFTYGFVSGEPIPPGASRVEITLEAAAGGTRLALRHDFGQASTRDQHAAGWRFQLSLFANIVADRLHGDAAARADAWFTAWAEPDEVARRRQLEQIASPAVRFHDRYASIAGLEDLLDHIAAVRRFMPGVVLTRQGDARHCQGTALVDWTASADGAARGTGANVFQFAPDGRIASVTGFWHAG